MEGWRTSFEQDLARAYVERFELRRSSCEPHAFNLAPNRPLQAAGSRYVSTQRATPSPLTVEQVTNLWVYRAS